MEFRDICSTFLALIFTVGAVPKPGAHGEYQDRDMSLLGSPDGPQSAIHFLDFDSVQVNWKQSDDQNNLNAIVSWRFNIEIEIEMKSLVRFVTASSCAQNVTASMTLSRWLSCNRLPDETEVMAIDVVTNTNTAVFQDLQFDTKYYVWIGLRFPGSGNLWQTCYEHTSPSCDEKIYGYDRCNRQCQQIAEPPRYFHVESISAVDGNTVPLSTGLETWLVSL
ncbi:uncharacterized protein [Ptychodera flava]|uniref:uncharacterized protein n=1 Tax=Ptychodera flava TaxID=63121 RepID=UPI00396A010E